MPETDYETYHSETVFGQFLDEKGYAARRLAHSHIFTVMKSLKKINQGDTYYENYLGHYGNWGDDFIDMYMLAWATGVFLRPRRILEIGVRTGISMCQLLSGYIKHNEIERVIGIDPFDDGFTSAGLVRLNLNAIGVPIDMNIELIKGKSEEELPKLIEAGEKFDYILVDGDHSKEAAARDLGMAATLIDTNGVILFDDISTDPGQCALIDVWEAFEKTLDGFDTGHTMVGKGVAWAIKK